MSTPEKRLLKEYKSLAKEFQDPESSIRKAGIVSLQPATTSESEDDNESEDLFHWNATILGIKDTPYQDTLFDLSLTIPQNYPLEPPTISFKVLSDSQIQSLQRKQSRSKSKGRTIPKNQLRKCYKIQHPNIAAVDGKICLDILQDKWSPIWTLSSAVIAIIQLLNDPEPLSPLNIDMANLLKCGDRVAYDEAIKFFIHKYSVLVDE